MTVFKTPRILSWIYPKRTWGFSMDKKAVYLTFDDGPTPELTTWILDCLEKEQVPATFFCVGENLRQLPQQVEAMVSKGHQLGNHTMRHEKGTNTKWKDYKTSVKECEDLVGNRLFRPPYGRIDMLQSAILAKDYRIIMWSWLSYDFDQRISVERILESAKRDIKSGDILVLHDNLKVEARVKLILPELIKIVREKNLSFELISA